ncbi:MAG: hypothetical protein JWN13_5949 [Betaproteobacteria bacterium]|jgi:hypothetical protein|nr:hypothetical protein [Betaproteobacteria bacterium]
MKTLKLTALASALFALGTVASPSTSVAAGNPDNGVHCPAGFDAQFAGGALKCVKSVAFDLSNKEPSLQCTLDAPFENFQRMARSQRDICLHHDSSIGTTDSLADASNGQVLISIPVGALLPRNLVGRQPTKVVNGQRFFTINENADYIFYDQSKTVSARAASKAKAIEIANERTLGVPGDEVNSRVVSITTTQTDANGTSLDTIEGKVNVTTFARP